MKFTYRKKGLPKSLRRIPGGVPGLVSACNIHFGPEWPAAKVAFFENRKSMDHFWRKILPGYCSGFPGGVRSRSYDGIVSKLQVDTLDQEHFERSGGELRLKESEVDRRYFCIVGLIVTKLTPEILAHEAVHVGFAWDYRHQGQGIYADPKNYEENVCYPAGIFFDQVTKFIEAEKLRR